MHKKEQEHKEMKEKETIANEDVSKENVSGSNEQPLENKEEPVVEVDGSVVSPEQQKEDFEAKYKETFEKFVRQTAEYDNYRKRTLKEKADLLKYGSEAVIKNMLPVIDDLEIAWKTIESSGDSDATKEGVKLILSKFNEFLKQNGVKEIEALEQDFNVDLHEAVTKIPSENLKGKVVDVLQKGYYLYDKVIRYAKVVVGE